MRKLLLLPLLFFTCIQFSAHAQESDNSLTVKSRHNIYPAADQGVVLLDRNLRQLTSGELAIGFSRYDSLLEKKWTNFYPFSKGMALAFHQVSDEGIYLLFTNNRRKEYELIVADTESGHYERSNYSFSEPLLVSELEAYYDQIWISGMVGQHPVIFKLNQQKNAYQTVPVGIPGELKYVGSLNYHASTSSLDYLILGNVDKKDVLLWRSVTEQGKVIVNERLPIIRNTIQGLRAVRMNDESIFVAGQYSVGTRTKIEGMFTAVMGPLDRITYKPFKELTAVSTYKRMQEVDKKGYASAKAVKFNKANRNVYIDQMLVNEAGEVEIALEIYTENFRARGTLEKQVIARDRTAQLDLNTYGRRNALSSSTEQETMEDRMRRGSATDQLQYKFMDQSLSKSVGDGMIYNHSGFMKYNASMKLLEENSLAFGMSDAGNLGQQTNYNHGALRYFKGGSMLSFSMDDKMIESQPMSNDETIQLLPWYEKAVLGVRFEANQNKGFTLYRFPVN